MSLPNPVAARLLGLRVPIPPGTWMSVVSFVLRHVEVYVTGRSLVQRSPTDCVTVIIYNNNLLHLQ